MEQQDSVGELNLFVLFAGSPCGWGTTVLVCPLLALVPVQPHPWDPLTGNGQPDARATPVSL